MPEEEIVIAQRAIDANDQVPQAAMDAVAAAYSERGQKAINS